MSECAANMKASLARVCYLIAPQCRTEKYAARTIMALHVIKRWGTSAESEVLLT